MGSEVGVSKGRNIYFGRGLIQRERRELGIFQEWPRETDLVLADGNGTLIDLEGIRLRGSLV